MREKRIPIQNLIKILYVFWATLLLNSCTEEKEFIENNPKNKCSIKEYNWNEANKIMKFKESQSKVINSLKSKDNNATSRQVLGFEVDENLVKEISSEDYTSYNMLIIREQQSQGYFENLVIEIKGDTTNAYLVKYIPSPENSSAENNLNGDFNGEIETSKVYGQTCFVCPEDVSNPDASGIGIGLGGATSICVTMYKCYTPDPSLPNLSIPHISYCGDCEQIPFSSCSGSASPLGSSNPSTGSNVGPGNGAMHGGSGTNNTTTNPINNPIVTPVAPTLTQIIDSFVLNLSPQEQLWWNNQANSDLVKEIKTYLAKKFPNIALEDFELADEIIIRTMQNPLLFKSIKPFLIEKQIDDSNLNPCQKNVLAAVKNSTDSDIAKVLAKLDANKSVYNTAMKTEYNYYTDPYGNVQQVTSPANTVQNSPYNYTIYINPDYAGKTKLFIASLMFHELVHAYFMSIIDDYRANPFNNQNLYNLNSLPSLFQAYCDRKYPPISGTAQNIHHLEMANSYVSALARALQEYQTGTPVPAGTNPDQIYTDLAWGGLNGTPIFNATYPVGNPDRERILNRTACEQNGTPIGQGTPNQQNPIGQPCN